MKNLASSQKSLEKHLDEDLKRWRRATNAGLTSYQLALSQVSEEKANLKELKKDLKAALKVQKLVQDLSERVQRKAHKRIAAVVTKCLTTVWGKKAYEFRIEFAKKRNKTEASLMFYKDGNPVDPKDASGDGAVDIASFALRIACILFSQPPLRRFVALDEPFKHLHPPVVKYARRLLDELSKELEIQFVVITHSKILRKGKKVVRIK